MNASSSSMQEEAGRSMQEPQVGMPGSDAESAQHSNAQPGHLREIWGTILGRGMVSRFSLILHGG